ncbi:MAG: hypothetical protein QXD43_05470 [Candidatus Aenigmatarchaeota archaeon]
MQRFIPRDPFESDKRVGLIWWGKEEENCDYCIYKDSKTCDYCILNKKRRFPYLNI